jgi:hypothetical protein
MTGLALTFKEYAETNRRRYTSEGDFARDFLASGARSPRTFRALMVGVHRENSAASLAARQAALKLWNAYQNDFAEPNNLETHERECALVTWELCRHSWDVECGTECETGTWENCTCR